MLSKFVLLRGGINGCDWRYEDLACGSRGAMMKRILAVGLVAALVLAARPPQAHANTGSGMVGEHPTDYLHDDLNGLREAHQLVVCGLRDQTWFDSQLNTLAKRAFMDSMRRSHGEHPALNDVAFAIHDVVAENVSVRTTVEDCRNFGSSRLIDEGAERLREVRESLYLIQSGAIFVMPPAAPVETAAAAPPPGVACVLKPMAVVQPVMHVHHVGPVTHPQRRAQVALSRC